MLVWSQDEREVWLKYYFECLPTNIFSKYKYKGNTFSYLFGIDGVDTCSSRGYVQT